MAKIDEDIAFLQSIRDVAAEFEAAKEFRKSDPARWEEASEKYAAIRTFWRQVALGGDTAPNTILAPPIVGSGTTKGG